jgi:hypothetical protein
MQNSVIVPYIKHVQAVEKVNSCDRRQDRQRHSSATKISTHRVPRAIRLYPRHPEAAPLVSGFQILYRYNTNECARPDCVVTYERRFCILSQLPLLGPFRNIPFRLGGACLSTAREQQ